MQNQYAPPKAPVQDIARESITEPLWNPNAAANWSLLFSPAFGAYLHMKNWEALGQRSKATSARVWFVLTLVLILGLSSAAVIGSSRFLMLLVRPTGFVLLVSWYFASARGQAAYVKNQLGGVYPKRGWVRPISIAVLAFVAYIVLVGVMVGVFGARA